MRNRSKREMNFQEKLGKLEGVTGGEGSYSMGGGGPDVSLI